ncbi:hypothetical protein ACLXAZ_32925, partial [Escherichia coli]
MLGNKNESSSPINLDASLDVSKRVLTEPPSIVMILGRDAPPRGVRKQPSNGDPEGYFVAELPMQAVQVDVQQESERQGLRLHHL